MQLQLLRLLPVKKRIVFYSGRKNDELDSNALALFGFVHGNKAVCAKKKKELTKWERLRFAWLLATSQVIVTDDYCWLLKYFPLKKKQRVIQIWHACGAFKKFGLDGSTLTDKVEKATHAQYSLVAVSGDGVREVYAKAFDIPLERVQALGIPRTDALLDTVATEHARECVYEKHPEWRNKHVIQYAPTFRDIKGKSRTCFEPVLDFDRLSDSLAPDQVFVITPHPVMTNPIVSKAYSNICVVRDVSTYDVFNVSEQLITDYSSVIFEYALLKKPIAFYCYDLEEYSRGFYLRYPEDLPGPVFRSQSELEKYLSESTKVNAVDYSAAFIRKYMSSCDGHSSERIADIINKYIEAQ